MRIYLKYINPIISVLVLLLCLWAAMNDDGFKPRAVIQGGIPTYFVAKGLFCSAALFLVGRILGVLEKE